MKKGCPKLINGRLQGGRRFPLEPLKFEKRSHGIIAGKLAEHQNSGIWNDFSFGARRECSIVTDCP